MAEDNMDAVVSTLVLCSVPNLTGEVLRSQTWWTLFIYRTRCCPTRNLVARYKVELNRFGKYGDGCNPDRETWLL